MRSFTSGMAMGVAASAAAMSIVSAFFVPYGYPWPSFAWAVFAGALAVWVAKRSTRPTPSMSDVITTVEGELARAPSTAKRGVVSTRAAS